jgi:hypothetical protein
MALGIVDANFAVVNVSRFLDNYAAWVEVHIPRLDRFDAVHLDADVV